MRIRARLGLHLLLLLGPVALAAACGTDAIGIDACQKIEQFRCDLAPYCAAGTTEEDTASCKVFYRDQCQHGLENNERTPSNGEVDACIDALNRAASCHVSGRATLAECPDIALASGIVGSAVAPCTLVMEHPEYLAACAFIAKPVESLPTPDAGGGAGGATGTGGAGGGT